MAMTCTLPCSVLAKTNSISVWFSSWKPLALQKKQAIVLVFDISLFLFCFVFT